MVTSVTAFLGPTSTWMQIAPVTQTVRHFFTVDVEEYFQVNAFDEFIARQLVNVSEPSGR